MHSSLLVWGSFAASLLTFAWLLGDAGAPAGASLSAMLKSETTMQAFLHGLPLPLLVRLVSAGLLGGLIVLGGASRRVRRSRTYRVLTGTLLGAGTASFGDHIVFGSMRTSQKLRLARQRGEFFSVVSANELALLTLFVASLHVVVSTRVRVVSSSTAAWKPLSRAAKRGAKSSTQTMPQALPTLVVKTVPTTPQAKDGPASPGRRVSPRSPARLTFDSNVFTRDVLLSLSQRALKHPDDVWAVEYGDLLRQVLALLCTLGRAFDAASKRIVGHVEVVESRARETGQELSCSPNEVSVQQLLDRCVRLGTSRLGAKASPASRSVSKLVIFLWFAVHLLEGLSADPSTELRIVAGEAYDKSVGLTQSWVVRSSVKAGLRLLPSRAAWVKSSGVGEEKEMKRMADVLRRVAERVDGALTERGLVNLP